MASGLSSIPNELFENISQYLSLADLCALRLTDRTVAHKATQDRFGSFFRSKSVALTETDLQLLVRITEAQHLVRHLEALTLVGLVHDPHYLEATLRNKAVTVTERHGAMTIKSVRTCDEEELARATDDLRVLYERRREYEAGVASGRWVELLTAAFAYLRRNLRDGELQRLTLEVGVYELDARTRVLPEEGGQWSYIWRSAAETYHVAMGALGRSGLPLQELNVFGGANMRRCSIAREEVGKFDFESLRPSLTAIKALTVSFSDRVVVETEPDQSVMEVPTDEIDQAASHRERAMRELQADLEDEENFTGLADMVALCPRIEELDLHGYSLYLPAVANAKQFHERLLQRLVTQTSGRLHHLRKLRLRNVFMMQEDILRLLANSPVQDLTMEEVHIVEGTYRRLFDHCTSDQAGMTRIFFDDLWEPGHLYFDEPGEPKFPTSRGGHGTNTLKREGDAVRRHISYHSSAGRARGSPAHYHWGQQRRAEDGPP